MKGELPFRRNAFLRWLGSWVLKLMDWRIAGGLPNIPKGVLIVAPHTSNWDFIIGIAAKYSLELDAHWLGKHTLFRKPFAPLFRWLGGTPVIRNASHGIVQQTIDIFDQNEQFLLGLSPEGTRKRVAEWRSGFYYIAKGANVPIIPVAFDYATRTIQIGEALYTSDSMRKDFEILQRFFAMSEGKIKENFNKEIAPKDL